MKDLKENEVEEQKSNSSTLIAMAHREWKNREERKPNAPNERDWCSGWMDGFLSVDKPDWLKERAEKILPEKPCDICLLNDLAANDYEKLKEHDYLIEQAAREKVLEELYSLAEDQIVDAANQITGKTKMSDALSDIRKDDHNRPRYSQVEYEAAIKEAREDERRKSESLDETILDSFEIHGGEVEMISHGGAGHKMLVNWVNFYEANGGKNYFTTTLSGTVRGEYRKYEITIRNCVGNKSPAEEIVELKNQLVVALENGAKNERERIRKFLYPDKIRWKDGMFHYVTWGDVFESLRTPSNKESK